MRFSPSGGRLTVTEEDHREHLPEIGAHQPEINHAPGESAQSAPPTGGTQRTIWWLGALLLLVIAGVGSSPFWARDIASLLPWRGKPEAPMADFAALNARLAAVEKRPAPPVPDLSAISSAVSELTRRVDQLESARNADRQPEAVGAVTKADLQQLEQRLNALDEQSASRTNSETAEFAKLRQELSQFGSVSTDLGDRLSSVERKVGAAGVAPTNDALLAALFRMREAVEAARPFGNEYDAFTALAHDQPGLIAAAKPLAESAQAGVPSRAVLSDELGKLSGRIAPAATSPRGSDLGTQALAWLHSLVTVHRIDAAVQTEQQPAMRVAEAALARDDLSGAVSALQTLSGSNSGAIQSWLQTARQRLAAEAALGRLQELLVARLGTPAEAPAGVPTEAPAKSASPS